MTELKRSVKEFRRAHPVFFWGLTAAALLLLTATLAMGIRIPTYRAQAQAIDRAMSDAERAARDRILNSQARRSELAIALLQRELRLRALEENGAHVAISVEDSTLSFRHGPAVLRETRVTIGGDSTITAPDGRQWRLVQALGERHLAQKEVNPAATIPEWVYVARGEAVPPEEERRIDGALGRYVLRLDDGTEIHTRPDAGPFTEGARPGAFIVENERDMRAIFEALRVDTPVYIY